MYYQLAQQEFESYLNGYDRENDRIKLKIIHTYGVVKQAEELVERMHLSAEDTDLARLIALLHDIGRFEQLKRYDSFEPGTMDHAAYGVKVLFDEGMIRRFLPDDKWDSIIYTAIAHHSDYELPEISDPQTLLHAKLIRDEDKLDSKFAKLYEEEQSLSERLVLLKSKNQTSAETQAKLDKIIDMIEHEKFELEAFDNVLIRKLIECVKVLSKTEILVIFKGGYEVRKEIE